MMAEVNEPPKNKKEYKQARNWCFTDFNVNDHSKKSWEKFYEKHKDIEIRYLCVGAEICPKTGRPHWQGWIQLCKKKTLGGMKQLFNDDKIHFTACTGSEEANDTYCKKGEKFFTWGEWIKQGRRNDLIKLKKMLDEGKPMKEIADVSFGAYLRYHKGFEKYKEMLTKASTKEFRKVEVILLYGKTGIGKTRKAMEEATYKIDANSLNWWDGYDGDKTICIDEFANQIPITQLLGLLDGYQYRLPIKGGFTYASWTKVYITTNLSLYEIYPKAKHEHRCALDRRITSKIDIAEVTGNTNRSLLITKNEIWKEIERGSKSSRKIHFGVASEGVGSQQEGENEEDDNDAWILD